VAKEREQLRAFRICLIGVYTLAAAAAGLPLAGAWAKLPLMAPPRPLLGAVARFVLWAGLALAGLFLALVALYAFVDPVSTLMLARTIEGERYERISVRLDAVAPAAVAAVIASEDATFCQNDGVDWGALHEVMRGARHGEPKRGASTITMQTAKNLFLWPGRSVLRKGVEIGMALVLGKAWSKRRVMEIYLNVAEWGDGLYGIEAAARRYFHKPASRLDAYEGALLATALPNPILRNPAHPRLFQRRLAAAVMGRAEVLPDRLGCLKPQHADGRRLLKAIR
jgi:monofunctional glycosyltransferase